MNGKKEPVPASIGIYDGQFLTELHTHDSSGIMHVESPTKRTFDLGQFFGVWGVRLTPQLRRRLLQGAHALAASTSTESAYQGDPRTLVLKAHQEIVFVIGTPPAKIPSSYKFAPGSSETVRLFFAAPGWRNWSYAPDLKSGVRLTGA